MKPFVGEEGGDFAGGAQDRLDEKSGTEGGRVDKKEESVSGGAVISMAVEVDGEAPILDDGRGDGDHRHRTFADDDARIVDLAVGGETVFVYSFEEGISAVLRARPARGALQGAPPSCRRRAWISVRSGCGVPAAPRCGDWPHGWAWNARIAVHAMYSISCSPTYPLRYCPVFSPYR